MRRLLAPLAAVLALAATPAGAGEPLDLDLTRLGAPRASIWLAIPASLGPPSAGDAALLASESRSRFARLATDLALAWTSSLLQPASTTGHSGFQVDLEASYTGVSHGVVGATGYTPSGAGAPAFPRDPWQTRSMKPNELLVTSAHVRKALPFSIELGGRLSYLSQSSYFAAQVEAKWALLEGYRLFPDVALRGAYTLALGQRDLDLATMEYGLLVSKRFGTSAVMALTPYAAARLTQLRAGSEEMNFAPDQPAPATPAEVAASSGAFPSLRAWLYRTTAGLRLTSSAVSLAAEVTWFGGATLGEAGAGEDGYEPVKVPASLAGAVKFGFEF
ncbi:MAG: hypothetical protein IPO09_05525 [Anaeromyxobacter sp.]|nr:hypothetical protein [Anaeromyxobacter sp.]MBL0277390.1 hypothetical protein [Anaeromyxobacter sp.]